MYIKSILSFSIILITVLFSCNKECIKHYNFENHYKLYPALDSFHINDTIWIEANIHKSMEDIETGELIQFTNQNLKTELFLAKIDEDPYKQNFSDFEIVEKVGELTPISTLDILSFRIDHVINDTLYLVKFGIVPKKIGLFSTTIYSFYETRRELEAELNIDTECKELVDDYYIILNNGLETNYEFIQLSPDEDIRNQTEYDYNISGGYSFYVIE